MDVPTPSDVFGKADAPPTLEYKDATLSEFHVVDDQKGIVEAIVSVTGVVDNVGDNIRPGAYEKTLLKIKPKGVWSHRWEDPISKTLDIKELLPGDPSLPKSLPDGRPWPAEAGALWVKTQFNLDAPRGQQAYSDVKFFGADAAWSIGYKVAAGGANVDTKSGVRGIDHLDLWEYSPVLHGAMPLAHTLSVKDAQITYREITLPENEVKEWKAKLGIEDKSVEPNSSPDATQQTDSPSRVEVVEATEQEAVEKSPIDMVPGTEEDEEEDFGLDVSVDDAKAFTLNSTSQVSLLRVYMSVKGILEEAGILQKEDRSVIDDIPLDVWDQLEPGIKAFNTAAEGGDSDTLDESAHTVLDVIERILPSADAKTKTALMAILDSIDEVFAEDAMPNASGDGDMTEEEMAPAPVEKAVMVELDYKDFKDFLETK